jgi:competence protein ComEA
LFFKLRNLFKWEKTPPDYGKNTRYNSKSPLYFWVMKNILLEYLKFSKKEGVALILLITALIVFIALPFINKKRHVTAMDNNDSALLTASKWNQQKEQKNYVDNEVEFSHYAQRTKDIYEPATQGVLFNFDPNTANADELKRLGLRDRTIQTIINYRNKGGKFFKPDDLKKIYGLHENEFSRLRPFIILEQSNNQETNYASKETNYSPKKYSENYTKHSAAHAKVIDINSADTAAFQSLYGIGTKLAARIVNFRNKLGGFYSVEQIKETYGVPDSTFQKIKPYLQLNNSNLHKLNINTATYDELNAHPYISSKLAYLIVKQRKEKGKISLEALKDIVPQTTDIYEKVINYVNAE